MNELTPLLEKLSEKLGTTTEYLWIVLIKQAHIQVIYYCIEFAIMGLSLFIFYKIGKYWLKNWNDLEDKYEFAMGVGLICIGILSFIFLVAFMIDLNSLVSALFNPEYWALKQILNVIN